MRMTQLIPNPLPLMGVEASSKTVSVTLPWWVKIVTERPPCTYFFGPFASASEARDNQAGYIEDLEQEGATGIERLILQDRPQTLTIYDEPE